MVREGAALADISAVFDTPDTGRDWLAEHALDADGEPDLMLRRVIDRQGRSKAFINGIPATLAQLRTLGEHLSISPANTPTKTCCIPPDSATRSTRMARSEEHPSELQSLMRNPYSLFWFDKKTTYN